MSCAVSTDGKKKFIGLFRNKKEFLAFLLFIILLTVENALLALMTTHYIGGKGLIKFTMLFAFYSFTAGMVLYLLPRPLSWLLLLANTIVGLLTSSWCHYLGDGPTLSALFAMQGQDMLPATTIANYIYLPAAALLISAFCINSFLLHFSRPAVKFVWRIPIMVICLGIYVFGYNHYISSFGLHPLKIEEALHEDIGKRGYYATWLGEALFPLKLGEEKTCSTARISRVPKIPVGKNLVYVQVECLGDIHIGMQWSDECIMPFLTEIAQKGAVLKVSGEKKFSSSNSDYEILNTRVANKLSVYYRMITDFPDSIAKKFNEKGYDTAFFHSVHGPVFHYRDAAERMGFKRGFFREELLEEGYPITDKVYLPNDDYDLFAYAVKQIPQDEPFFHVLMTRAMHEIAKVYYPKFSDSEDAGLFTSCRISDDSIRYYAEALPPDTTLVIMGDHKPYHGPRTQDTVCIIYTNTVETNFETPDDVFTRCEVSHYLRELFDLGPVAAELAVCEY